VRIMFLHLTDQGYRDWRNTESSETCLAIREYLFNGINNADLASPSTRRGVQQEAEVEVCFVAHETGDASSVQRSDMAFYTASSQRER
jgi:hypothetical protein